MLTAFYDDEPGAQALAEQTVFNGYLSAQATHGRQGY
jgi:hypothetical protein